MIYDIVFQVIYNFHKHLNGMYTDNTPLGHFVDHAIEHSKHYVMYDLEVRDLIFMTTLIHHKLDLKRVSSSVIQILNERDRQLTPLPFVDYNALTQNEINVFDTSLCVSDRVEITTSELNVKPYR